MGKHWLDGLWYYENTPFLINEVKGENALWRNTAELDYPEFETRPLKGTWTHGKFHETLKEIKEKTGATHYNVKMEFFGGKFLQFGVLDEDGKSVTLCNFLNFIGNLFDKFELLILALDRFTIVHVKMCYRYM